MSGKDSSNLKNTFITDSPIEKPSDDLFRRWPFAQRVAKAISSRSDPSSIVIGIFGEWGEGKTSVMNFIESELKKQKEIACVKFNPWRFGEENKLLIYFFQTLADALDKSLSTKGEKIGE